MDLPAALGECARVLRPGGIFLACREHVVRDAAELQAFLAGHPVHALAGGENAHTLAAYVSAIEGSGLRLDRVIGPWESVINTYPGVRTMDELADLPRQRLVTRFGPLGAIALKVPGVRAAVWARISKPTPGNMFTFLARKPR